MRSCLVEVRYIRIEDALELLLMKDQQVVETFLPHTLQEALTDRIGGVALPRDRSEIVSRRRGSPFATSVR
jgi:hypothetical protein